MDQLKQTKLQIALSWARQHRRLVAVGIAVSVIIIVGAVSFVLTHKKAAAPVVSATTEAPEAAPEPVKYYSPLTGQLVADEAATKRQVTAVMIENSPDARPQSGLKDAGVVYEAIAEGGITRFAALYQEARPGLIGPVRSVRPYYVEWAAAYDPAVAHIGGSKKALEMIRSGNYGKDIDQFFNAGTYYRSSDRYAPHNVYTTFDRLDALNQAKGNTSSAFTGLSRKDDTPDSTKNATHINISISSTMYNPTYTYDQTSNSYTRLQNNQSHVDREGGQIMVKNVAVIKVPTSLGFEDGYREQMQVIGSGEATVFMDGAATAGTWTKADAKQPLIFKDQSGKEISFNRGNTWITAIPTDRNITWQ